jgi:Tol biopolymer transport system component
VLKAAELIIYISFSRIRLSFLLNSTGMAKKIFFFSLGFFVLVLIFLGAYNFAFKNNVNDPVADPTKKEFGKEEEEVIASPESITNPINEAVLGATASEDGMLYYYSLDDHSLKKATLEGRNKTVLMSNFPGTASRVLWSPKNDRVLLFLKQASGGTLWYSANITTKSLIPLKADMSRLVWDNLGEKIFYQYTDPSGKRSLNIANSDGSAWKKLADLGTKDSFLASVPQSSLVSFWARPLAREKSPLETVNTVGENRRTLSGDFFGSDYSWAPNGENVVISGSDTSGGALSLRIIPSTGGKASDLSIPTLISKTTWSKDGRTLYYALPGALPEGSVLPDDYFGKPLYTKDTFWKVDVVTGKKTRLIDLKENTQALDSSDLFLSPKEDFLYFIDRVSKRLYSIEL